MKHKYLLLLSEVYYVSLQGQGLPTLYSFFTFWRDCCPAGVKLVKYSNSNYCVTSFLKRGTQSPKYGLEIPLSIIVNSSNYKGRLIN